MEYAGETTQKNLLLRDIRNFEVEIPDESHQKKIIEILNIDQLISVNKKLNKNLEQLIKYIYINWFEEFEPFKDRDFYDTKLGSIPVGWEVKPLQDFIKFQEGPGIRNWQYVEKDGINFLNIRCIQNNDFYSPSQHQDHNNMNILNFGTIQLKIAHMNLQYIF